jgi:hypothetical protein
MSHNEPITASSALPILIDSQPGEKEDGGATWIGDEPHPRAVRRFNEQDAQIHRKSKKKDRFESVGRLIGAMARKDKGEIAKRQRELSGIIDAENAANRKYDLDWDYKHYRGWVRLRAHYGAKTEFWYGRRDRRRKLYGPDARFSIVLRDVGLEVPSYSPPVGRKGTKGKEEWKNYHKHHNKQFREMERKLDEILAGERLAPSLENAVSLSHWQLSKILAEAKLVLWHYKRSFQPALYCGGDLNVAYWAYVFTKNLLSLSSKEKLCEGCGEPFVVTKSSKTHCTHNCQVAHAMRRSRANKKRLQRTHS